MRLRSSFYIAHNHPRNHDMCILWSYLSPVCILALSPLVSRRLGYPIRYKRNLLLQPLSDLYLSIRSK